MLNTAANGALRHWDVVTVDGVFDDALRIDEHALGRLAFSTHRLTETRCRSLEVANAVASLVRLEERPPELLARFGKRVAAIILQNLRFFHCILDQVQGRMAESVPRSRPTGGWGVASLIGIGSIIAMTGCAVAPPAPGPSRPMPLPPSSQPAGGAVNAVAEEIVVRTNDERRALHIPAFTRSQSLMRAAQLQANQMATRAKMAHELPGAAYPSLGSRLAAAGYQMSAAGENIAEGQPTAPAVVAGWMKSPGHRTNMLDTRFTEMGAGVATANNGRRFYAQVFARPR